jgi:hypothetical protein
MTPSDLKYHHERLNPDSHFFDRDAMRYFGDTMKNYGVIAHEDCYELRRKRAVKEGIKFSTYFDKVTFAIRRDLGRKSEW